MNSIQISKIENTVQAIELRMKKDLNLDVLSNEVGLSKYHLHHLFRSLTDKTLMTYVRNRKLSCSLYELLHSDLNIIDIASDYCFEHEQSYIRAFKQKFKLTPAKYRKKQCQLEIEPRIDTNRLKQVGQGIVIQPKVVMQPLFHMQGIQRRIVHSENYMYKTTNQLAEEFWREYRPLIANVKDDHTYIGFVLYSDHPDIYNDYATCVEVTQPCSTNEPFVQYTLPAQEYAVFRYVGFHNPHEISLQTLCQLYNYIDNEWLINTSYRQIQPYHFEKMDLKNCRNDYCEMDIYIPILLD